MSTYTMIKLSVPAILVDALGRLATILDQDVGGGEMPVANASADGLAPATSVIISAPVTVQTHALISSKDPDSWFSAMDTAAASRGRSSPLRKDCDDLCPVIKIDAEITDKVIESA